MGDQQQLGRGQKWPRPSEKYRYFLNMESFQRADKFLRRAVIETLHMLSPLPTHFLDELPGMVSSVVEVYLPGEAKHVGL